MEVFAMWSLPCVLLQLALPALQQTLYASYFRSEEVEAAMRERFNKSGKVSSAALRAVNNVTMELRKCAIHPFLCSQLSDQLWLIASEDRNTRAYATTSGSTSGAWWLQEARADFEIGDLLDSDHSADRALYWRLFTLCSAKAQWLDTLLPELRAAGHRVLLFSQVSTARARLLSQTRWQHSLLYLIAGA
jgi:SNF2 family DNA or RNA helicase